MKIKKRIFLNITSIALISITIVTIINVSFIFNSKEFLEALLRGWIIKENIIFA